MASIPVCCVRGPVQRVLGNVATRIIMKCNGMHNQHIGILLPDENADSHAGNGVIRIAPQGATACLCGRN